HANPLPQGERGSDSGTLAPWGRGRGARVSERTLMTGDVPRSNEPAAEPEIHRGLNGVYFDRTESTFIDGRAGTLLYRGYSIHDLAEHSTFEETSYLLLHGDLPTRAQLEAFDSELRAARPLPSSVLDVIATLVTAHPQSHPMDILRTAVSA